eukprot:8033611-Pyramimonas_sp.AAC.1
MRRLLLEPAPLVGAEPRPRGPGPLCGKYLYPYPERRGLVGKGCRKAEPHWIWIKNENLLGINSSISSAPPVSGEESPKLQDALD